MTDIKVTTYVLTVVDLQCCKCYTKVKKLLCKYKEIRDQVYDPKRNTVTIKVYSCTPERIRRELICKGCKFIRCISPPPPPPPPQDKPPSKPPQDPKPDPTRRCCNVPVQPCGMPPPYWYPPGGPCYYCYRVDCVCFRHEECRGAAPFCEIDMANL